MAAKFETPEFGTPELWHLKAIAVDNGGKALLRIANVEHDAEVVDVNDTKTFCCGKDKPMGQRKIRSNLDVTASSVVHVLSIKQINLI